jgi:hypothetical protein
MPVEGLNNLLQHAEDVIGVIIGIAVGVAG